MVRTIEMHALGAVRVTREGEDVSLGGPRQRRLLAVLLIHRNAVVSVDRIAEAVFAGVPTAAAGTTLRSYVARLRKVLDPDGTGARIVTRAPGYQLTVDASCFDVAGLEAILAEGQAALHRNDPVTAAERLRSADRLWQGDAYAEFADEDWAYPESQRLAELRLAGHEHLVEAELACGRAPEILPMLEALCREHPLREGIRAQLMTAYYRSGRQADALAEFRAFRDELAEELGIDPSLRLVEMERRILAQDVTLLADANVGQPLRGYRLGERLGTGREGTVHAAHLPGVERTFVVKTLRHDLADDPGFIRAFESAAHRVASLRHPGALQLHDYWREPGAAHVVSRRLPGGTLRDRLQRRRLTSGEVTVLVDRIGGALVTAAAHEVVHGRVCAENVLYDAGGQPVLTDFWLGVPRSGISLPQDVRDFVELVREGVASAGLADQAIDCLLDQGSAGNLPDIAELVTGLLRELNGSEPEGGRLPNPYQGLRAFDEADAANYFGRAELIDDILGRLSEPGTRGRVVLLVGASGTGKSSAVRAGLLPRLRADGAQGSHAWFVATMLPGSAPYKELGESLRRIAVVSAEQPVPEVARDQTGIDRALRQRVPEGGQLVLVLDQFEELFTLAPEKEQRSFLRALAYAVMTPDSRLRLVATLRADYYDRPLGFQPFGSLVNTATVTIPAMLPAEVEAAVVEPALRAGRTVERALAAELVGSLATEPAALPALQFVLYELAEHGSPGLMTLAEYRALGGIEGAIATRAEQLYLSFDDRERTLVRELFERLVVIGPEGEPTRRRAVRGELASADEIVDSWAQARLLTLDVHPQTRVPTVEVAHEALVRGWPRLRRWIEHDRSELIVLNRLREAAATWSELGRDASALYRGTSLEAALDVASRRTGMNQVETEFVRASQAAREGERAQEVELIRSQARTNRRLRVQLSIIGIALVGALVGGFLAIDQRGQAIGERHVATARELAAAADANLGDDPERSMLLALRAIDVTRSHGEPVLPEAQEALHRAVTSSRILLNVPGVGGTLDWSPDGRYFATEGPEESGIVDIRDARTGRSVRSFRGHGIDVNDVSFGANGRLLATSGDDGAVKVWAVPSGRNVLDSRLAGAKKVWGPSISPDGALTAASWLDVNRVRVLRTRTGEVVADIPVELPVDTTFNPHGDRLAVSSAVDGRVHVFDARSGRLLVSSGRDPAGIRDVAWSPDGRLIAGASGDGSAHVIEARTGRLRFTTSGNIAGVNGVDWSADSRSLAAASDDGTVRISEVGKTGTRNVLTLAAQDMRNGARSVAFSPDGRRLMTSDWSVTSVKIWDVSPTAGAEIANVEGATYVDGSAVFTSDGRSVYVPDPGGAVSRWNIRSGARTQRLSSPSDGEDGDGHDPTLALSPDGNQLAVATGSFPVQVWDTRTGRVAFSVGRGWEGDLGGIAWSTDGQRLAVAVNEEHAARVEVVDAHGASLGTVHEQPDVAVVSVSLAKDNLLATTARDPRDDPGLWNVRIWDWTKDKLLRRLGPGSGNAVYDPTGDLLVSRRIIDGLAEVWNPETGQKQSTLFGHTGLLSGLAFSRDGRRVATASADGSVRIWDPLTGTLQVALRGPGTIRANGVQFSPDGSELVSTWDDGIARVWALGIDDLTSIARERLTRGLTRAECRQYLHTERCPTA
jgi:WD40 repeat protein/DNA-binding SARP family transcriptional activator